MWPWVPDQVRDVVFDLSQKLRRISNTVARGWSVWMPGSSPGMTSEGLREASATSSLPGLDPAIHAAVIVFRDLSGMPWLTPRTRSGAQGSGLGDIRGPWVPDQVRDVVFDLSRTLRRVFNTVARGWSVWMPGSSPGMTSEGLREASATTSSLPDLIRQSMQR